MVWRLTLCHCVKWFTISCAQPDASPIGRILIIVFVASLLSGSSPETSLRGSLSSKLWTVTAVTMDAVEETPLLLMSNAHCRLLFTCHCVPIALQFFVCLNPMYPIYDRYVIKAGGMETEADYPYVAENTPCTSKSSECVESIVHHLYIGLSLLSSTFWPFHITP